MKNAVSSPPLAPAPLGLELDKEVLNKTPNHDS